LHFAKSTASAGRCFAITGPERRSTKTSDNFQQGDFTMMQSLQSTSSAAAIRVSLSASPEISVEQRTRAISGRKCLDSYEKSGRDGSFAKTLLATLNSVSTPYSMTWRMQATPQRHSLFQLAPSGRRIGGTVYGLLPTPLASDCRGRWNRPNSKVRNGDNLLRNYLPRRFGGIYPHPSLLETMMGFPPGWTDLTPSATP
jgi:hypothetical protein